MELGSFQKTKKPVNHLILLAFKDINGFQKALKAYSHSIVAGGLPLIS